MVHNTWNLRYKIPKNIPVIFHNGSKYDYHFIIKELASEFDGNFECLGENAEKYITFSVPIKKRIEHKNIDITYKIKFIDSFRFMSTSLSKLVENLTDGVHNDGRDRFNEKTLPNKESFYSSLMMEDKTASDYPHANNVFKKI